MSGIWTYVKSARRFNPKLFNPEPNFKRWKLFLSRGVEQEFGVMQESIKNIEPLHNIGSVETLDLVGLAWQHWKVMLHYCDPRSLLGRSLNCRLLNLGIVVQQSSSFSVLPVHMASKIGTIVMIGLDAVFSYVILIIK